MKTNGLVEALAALLETLNKNGWVACPLCGAEFTRLRYCGFQREGGLRDNRLVCVDCAETPRAIPAVAAIFPVGFEVRMEDRDARGSPKRASEVHAFLRYGGAFTYRIWKKGYRLAFRREEMPENPAVECDNIFEAYFRVSELVARGDVAPAEGLWTEFKPRKTPERRKPGKKMLGSL